MQGMISEYGERPGGNQPHNKKREQKVDVFDLTTNLVYQRVNSQVYDPQFAGQWLDTLKEEIKAKVKEKVYTYGNWNNRYNKNNKGLRNDWSKDEKIVTIDDLNKKFEEDRQFSWETEEWRTWQY